MAERSARGALLITAWAGFVAAGWLVWTLALERPLRVWWHRASPREKTVLFVVMDTVRADRLSLCGHDRPTSPTLERLREQGAAVSCRAIAPGSWTYPSHASYFTGAFPWEHGAHFVPAGEEIRKLVIRPLEPRFETLAEHFAAQGHQTVGLSGNPVLQPASGLTQGFESWGAAQQFGGWYGDRLVRQLERALQEDVDPEGGPLFLFVNIADAHDPWDGVPAGLDWVEPQDELLVYFETDDEGRILEDGPWHRYVRGELEEAEAGALRRRVTDLYDHALFEADATLGRVLEAVEASGWADAGLRLVVVSDHGEFLGEHGLLRHGRYLWEGNNRVFLLVHDTEGPVSELPEPVSAMEAHTLVRDGVRPAELPVLAAAWPDRTWLEESGGAVGGSTSVALWTAEDKVTWQDGAWTRRWPARDPAELQAEPVGEDDPVIGVLGPVVSRVQASADRALETDPALIEALRSAGYVE
jgi:hypothetical protein